MNISNFEEFLNEHDAFLFESFPEVLTSLDKNQRNLIARQYGLGPDSEQYELGSPGEATWKANTDQLLVYVGNDGKPFAYGIGTSINTLFFRRRGNTYNRKRAIEDATKVFLITSDKKSKEKAKTRYDDRWKEHQEELNKYAERAKNLIKSYEEKLIERLEKEMKIYDEGARSQLDSLKSRVKSGEIYFETDIIKNTREMEASAKKIAAIGNIFWKLTRGGFGSFNDQASVTEMSKKIKAALS